MRNERLGRYIVVNLVDSDLTGSKALVMGGGNGLGRQFNGTTPLTDESGSRQELRVIWLLENAGKQDRLADLRALGLNEKWEESENRDENWAT